MPLGDARSVSVPVAVLVIGGDTERVELRVKDPVRVADAVIDASPVAVVDADTPDVMVLVGDPDATGDAPKDD